MSELSPTPLVRRLQTLPSCHPLALIVPARGHLREWSRADAIRLGLSSEALASAGAEASDVSPSFSARCCSCCSGDSGDRAIDSIQFFPRIGKVGLGSRSRS
jgi:hypothetical protein